MVGQDHFLATLFYHHGSASSECSSRARGLTLDNLKMHNKVAQDQKSKFYPRLNKVLEHSRLNQATTNYTGHFSVFDALYELENMN